MIAKLKGRICDVFDNFLILDVAGVGYRVEGLNISDGEIEIYVYTHVREQEIRLFGFVQKEELLMFEKLLAVSGIGPKGALSLVQNCGVAGIVQAIEEGEAKLLVAPGIGKKTAERVVLELKGKLNTLANLASSSTQNVEAVREAVQALEGLGYNREEIQNKIKEIEIRDDWQSVDIIKKLLQILGKNK